MEIYISVDMEGVAGVATLDQIFRGGFGYPEAARLMTLETNAAIAGAFDAGATSVTVNDSHGAMDNLIPAELDSRARLITGSPKAQCMAQGISSRFDAALFIGYHGAASSDGVLAHTVSSHFVSVTLNGVTVSEADINALYAATHGVPVAFLSGDDIICSTTGTHLPHATKVAVKNSIGWTAADSVHPSRAAELIRSGVVASLSSTESFRTPALGTGWTVGVQMQQPTAAELAALLPGAIRTGLTGVEHAVGDLSEVIGLLTVWSALAQGAALQRLPMLQRR